MSVLLLSSALVKCPKCGGLGYDADDANQAACSTCHRRGVVAAPMSSRTLTLFGGVIVGFILVAFFIGLFIAPKIVHAAGPITAVCAKPKPPLIDQFLQIDPQRQYDMQAYKYSLDPSNGSPNVYFDASNPADFTLEGETSTSTSRMVRKNGFFAANEQFLATNATQANVALWQATGADKPFQAINILVSHDGLQWKNVPYLTPNPKPNKLDTWVRYDIAAPLPVGTNYVEIAWPSTATYPQGLQWISQISAIRLLFNSEAVVGA